MLSWNPITNSSHGHRRAINFSKTIMDAKVVSSADIFVGETAAIAFRTLFLLLFEFLYNNFTNSTANETWPWLGFCLPEKYGAASELKVIPWIVASSSYALPNWDRIAFSDLLEIVNIDSAPFWLLREPVYPNIYLILLAASATRPGYAITRLLLPGKWFTSCPNTNHSFVRTTTPVWYNLSLVPTAKVGFVFKC